MVDSLTGDGASLPELLARRARRASDARLAADVAGGLLGVAVALAWRPAGWFAFLSAAACFAAFGAWGIADRELAEAGAHRRVRGRLLRACRLATAAIGALAALTLIFDLCAVALGTWIS